MPTIPYHAEGFVGERAALNGDGDLLVTWPQIVWAAITAGKAEDDLLAHGPYSLWEIMSKLFSTFAYLRQSPSGRIVRSMAYSSADPSEKNAISYALGLSTAKLFAELIFDIPWLLHFSVYAADYDMEFAAGGSRPDLIGLNAGGEWFVFEAKGRTHGRDEGALAVAKGQAEQILTIGGVEPACRIASMSFFRSHGMHFEMNDPEGKEDGKRIKADRTSFRKTYTDRIRRAIESRRNSESLRVEGVSYIGTTLSEADLRLSVPEVAPAERVQPISTANSYRGGDGTFVELGDSWSEENMIREPYLR